eukprot:g1331.t1
MGSSIMHLATALLEWWRSSKAVFIGHSPWRYTDGKCGNGWSCFLTPLSRACPIETLAKDLPGRALAPNAQRQDKFPPLTRVCRTGGDKAGRYDIALGRCVCSDGFAPGHGDCVPYNQIGVEEAELYKANHSISLGDGEWAYYAPGSFLPMIRYVDPHGADEIVKSRLLAHDAKRFGRGVVLWKMMAQSPRRALLDKYVEGLGLDPATRKLPCIALHVRHGDACNKEYRINDVLERTCFPLQIYVNEIRRAMKRYGPHSVYLATDDPRIVEETSSFPDIDWKFQAMDRSKMDTLEVTDDNKLLATAAAAEEVWKDLWTLGQCDIAAGSMVSSILQLAMELQITRKGHFVPFYSVETPWGDPFLWGMWRHFQVGKGNRFNKPGSNCRCWLKEPPKPWPRGCKCDAALPKDHTGPAVEPQPRTCQDLANFYGVMPGTSFGCAPQEAQDWWVRQRCSTVPVVFDKPGCRS